MILINYIEKIFNWTMKIYLNHTKAGLEDQKYNMEIELENMRSQLRGCLHQNNDLKKELTQLKTINEPSEPLNNTKPIINNAILSLELKD